MTTEQPVGAPEAFEPKTEANGNVFIRAWQGKEHLALVWWGFGIPLKVITWALNTRWAVETVYRNSQALVLLVSLVTIAAYVVHSVMAWRCAPNTEEKGWKWVARSLLVASWAWFFYQLTIAT
jgi:hypothetical protein